MLISEWGRKQMQFFFSNKEKQILPCDYEKNKTKKKRNTLLIHVIVYKEIVELKSEERSMNGTWNEIFSAFKRLFFSFRETISLPRLLLEHIRQNKTGWQRFFVSETEPGSDMDSPFKCHWSTSAANLTL